MTHPCFFGYGSLVNRATHDYPNAAHATAHGWRRSWVHTAGRDFAFLTAIRAPNHQIDGLIAEVPNADWAALDEREHAYDRLHEPHRIAHKHPNASDIAIYAVNPNSFAQPETKHPILLSYLDVVLQGYLTEFKEKGALDFIATTDGWDAPILNDRAQPIYPRSQRLTDEQTDFVNTALSELGAILITP